MDTVPGCLVGGIANAALLAVKILGSSDPAYRQAMADYMGGMSKEVEAKAERLQEIGWKAYLEQR